MHWTSPKIWHINLFLILETLPVALKFVLIFRIALSCRWRWCYTYQRKWKYKMTFFIALLKKLWIIMFITVQNQTFLWSIYKTKRSYGYYTNQYINYQEPCNRQFASYPFYSYSWFRYWKRYILNAYVQYYFHRRQKV